MHEVSIALNLLEIITAQCRKEGYSRIDAVRIKIGRASGIMPDALAFAFEATKGDTIAGNALLEIEEVPLTGNCRDCGAVFTTEAEYVLACPECASQSFLMTAGRELDIIDMEVS
ncbi:MAG: hydrogenase maturation nickel metallochaperone HypA [Thermodesulfovibrio sp.]|nr:hydrogenase maturation nickel metallochaperone HypA [Thermodesulfovibrio sp.]